MALAFVHDDAIDKNGYVGPVKFAIECTDTEIIYHKLEKLEKVNLEPIPLVDMEQEVMPDSKILASMQVGPSLFGLEQKCRECGCTDDDACIHPKYKTCWWEEPDLCSHCYYWPGESSRHSRLEQTGQNGEKG